MKRWIDRFIFAVVLLPLICVGGVVLRDRLVDNSAATPASPFPEGKPSGDAGGAAADAAIALRSLTGTKAPAQPWLTNPGQAIVGHCSKPCLSEAEAKQSARNNAAGIFASNVLNQLGKIHGDRQWITGQITNDIQADRYTTDDLVEKFTRPYGTVWTDTVLIGVKPDSQVLDYRRRMQAHDFQSIHLQIAATAISLLSWGTYLLLNTITRGYFTLRLRLFAGTITAIALLVILGGQ